MSILENIQAARKQALIDKDSGKRTTLTTLEGEITTKAKSEGNRAVTDQDCIKVLTKFINGVNDSAKYITDPALKAKVAEEVAVYQAFMPAAKPQLSAEALHRVIRSVIASRLAGDGEKPKMGVVINDIKTLHEGAYDPKALAPLVKAELDATADPNKKD